jgi:hypothetical protein
MTTFTSDDRKSAYEPGLGCVTPSSTNGMEEPDLVAEAPFHPGYEDAVILKNEYQDILSTEDCMSGNQLNLNLSDTEEQNSLLRKRILELEKELEEYRYHKTRHMNTAQGIIDFIKT